MTDNTLDIAQLPFQPEQSPTEKRFWAKINKDTPNGCWLWTACVSVHGGYGLFQFALKLQVAHRVAWKLLFGSISDGLQICHNCPGGDNPACVNPAHMFLGTQKDNIQDCIDKGRRAEPYKPFGSLNPNNKLAENDIPEIRTRHEIGLSYNQLAKHFNVSAHTIGAICRREMWAWVP